MHCAMTKSQRASQCKGETVRSIQLLKITHIQGRGQFQKELELKDFEQKELKDFEQKELSKKGIDPIFLICPNTTFQQSINNKHVLSAHINNETTEGFSR